MSKMIEAGLVDPAKLRELYEQVEPDLYRYPAIEPESLRAKVDGLADEGLAT